MAARIWVTVKPRAKTEGVRKTDDGQYIATVHAPPQEGKANKALIELLANYFSVPKSSVRIVRGQTGRRKLIEIDSM
ncbi:MAG: DUF167 domain-containing protein [Deltaproteobacteria bacterium]|nr:DUF167 domain-containing protein [Deltaproteobacteria bacterium]